MEATTLRESMSKRRSSSPDKNIFWRNGRAYVRIQVNGQDRRRSLNTGDPVEARRKVKELQGFAEKERAGEVSDVTFNRAALEWTNAGMGVRSLATRDRYGVSILKLKDTFGPLKMHEITKRKIGEYVRKRQRTDDNPDGVSNATLRRDITALSRLLSWCVAHDYRDDNPARDWDRSTIREDREPIHRPCMKSFDACVKEASPMWAALLPFLLASGFRLNVDAAALQRAQVNWHTGVVTFRTKGGRIRSRELSEEAMRHLRAAPAVMGSPYVFAKPNGDKLSNLSRAFEDVRKRALKRAEREGWTFKSFRLHDLRHEYAIRFLKAGGSIYVLQQQLGHSSVQTTEIYTDFLTADETLRAKGLPSSADVTPLRGEHG